MQRYVKRVSQVLVAFEVFPVEKPWHKLEMATRGNREKFGQPLDNAKDDRPKD